MVPTRKRAKQLNIRLSEEEHQILTELVRYTRWSQSDIFRRLLLQQKLYPKEQLMRAMASVWGTMPEVNRLVRRSRERKYIDSETANEIRRYLSAIWQELSGNKERG